MTNLSVPYARPDRNLTTLIAEIDRLWPGRRPDLGYVTGYKSATNFTGHNADANGIVHAVDIGTYVEGDINEFDGRDLAEQLRLIGKRTNRFQYLIHDMSEGAPEPMIASAAVGWEWVPYDGPAAHSDHIHISTVDSYWGDVPVFYGTATPVPASYYDNAAPWGIRRKGAAAAPQAATITPIQEGRLFMSLTAAEEQEILAAARLINARAKYLDAPVSAVPGKVWKGDQAMITNRRLGRGEYAETLLGSMEDRVIRENLVPLTALVTKLAANGSSLTEAQITDAIKKGLAEGTVTVDVNVAGGTK